MLQKINNFKVCFIIWLKFVTHSKHICFDSQIIDAPVILLFQDLQGSPSCAATFIKCWSDVLRFAEPSQLHRRAHPDQPHDAFSAASSVSIPWGGWSLCKWALKRALPVNTGFWSTVEWVFLWSFEVSKPCNTPYHSEHFEHGGIQRVVQALSADSLPFKPGLRLAVADRC